MVFSAIRINDNDKKENLNIRFFLSLAKEKMHKLKIHKALKFLDRIYALTENKPHADHFKEEINIDAKAILVNYRFWKQNYDQKENEKLLIRTKNLILSCETKNQ